MPDRLPIYEIERDIIARLKADRRLILSAPTGSGKSTQVPQMLLQHGLLGDGQVVILQPRRLATRLLASRVAQELGVQLGHEVGYQIRFENVTSPQTKIRFVTEGVLLRQMIDDPKLRGVSVLIFDEFHERHLYGDITLARALDLQEQHRPDLCIVVMSATLDAEVLENYLSERRTPIRRDTEAQKKRADSEIGAPACSVLSSEGRVFPVEIKYAAQPGYTDKRPVWEQAAEAFSHYVHSGGEGDVLVFMPGGFEISQTIEAIRHTSESKGFILLPLHGELSPNDQDAAVARYDQRKVVVATNVAETSLTIDGMRLVIDSGLARIPRYDANRGINTLLIEKISQSTADQRAGRAGRTAPGVCMRLWSREEHGHRAAQELPEIKRLDLAEVVLTLKAAGVEDLRKFRWLEKPDEISLTHAEELLLDLGALKRSGRRRACLPIQIQLKRTKLDRRTPVPQLKSRPSAARCWRFRCIRVTRACCSRRRNMVVSIKPASSPRSRRDAICCCATWTRHELAPRGFARRKGVVGFLDSHARVELCRQKPVPPRCLPQARHPRRHRAAGRAVARTIPPHCQRRRTRYQTARNEGRGVAEVHSHRVFSDRVARRLDQGTLRCELVHNRRGVLARESVVQHSPLFVAAEVREVEGREVNTILSLATAIEVDWLRELFPDDMKSELHVAVRCHGQTRAGRRTVAVSRTGVVGQTR